jgi:hypothetical protein
VKLNFMHPWWIDCKESFNRKMELMLDHEPRSILGGCGKGRS